MRYTVYTNTNKQFMVAQLNTNSLDEAMNYATTLVNFNDVWVNDNYNGQIHTLDKRVL